MYYMNIMRGAMLLGSLGRVWARSNRTRNVFQSISILAYFKLMSDFENGSSNYMVIPDIQKPEAPKPPNKSGYTPNVENRRQKLSRTMKQVNMIINAR